jgi:hypothetical protein
VKRTGVDQSALVRVGVTLGAALAIASVFQGCQAFGGQPSSSAAAPDASKDVGFLACPDSGTCFPDPGSRPTDCSIASGIDTLPIVTFDDVNIKTGFYKAEGMYIYTDNTAESWFSNGQDLCIASLPPVPHASTTSPPPVAQVPDTCGFEPWTAPVDLCTPGNNALHLLGGPFVGWGGGIGVSMQKLNGRDTVNGDPNKALCAPMGGGPPAAVCPPDDAEYAVRVAALDVSAYEGVSFWARRGERSQTGLRLSVGDKHTDDDLNYYAVRQSAITGVPEPLYCQRVKECGCLYNDSCNYYDVNGRFFCRDPLDPKTQRQCRLDDKGQPVGNGTTSINGTTTNCTCGAVDVCNVIDPAFPNDPPIGADGQPITTIDPMTGNPVDGDTAFYGRACTPYQFPDGTGTSFCFNPGSDPNPAPGSERCGDHWATSVDLSPDWQFFRIPFKDLRQQGFAKKAAELDLHSVSVVRFTWDAGIIDYWIDAVSFYKRSNAGADQ